MIVLTIFLISTLFVGKSSSCVDEPNLFFFSAKKIFRFDGSTLEKKLEIPSNSTIEKIGATELDETLPILIRDANNLCSIEIFDSNLNFVEKIFSEENCRQIFFSFDEKKILRLFDGRTRRLKTFADGILVEERFFENLPSNFAPIDLIFDESSRCFWIFVATRPPSLFLCRIDANFCERTHFLPELQPPVSFLVEPKSKKIFLASKFEFFSFDRTNFSAQRSQGLLRYFDDCQQIRSAIFNATHFCTSKCFSHPFGEQNISFLRRIYPKKMFNCEKRNFIGKSILLALIFFDLFLLVLVVVWFFYLRKRLITHF